MALRTLLAAACRRTLLLVARPVSDAELRAPAIVFAPHQDDETLGCGGTVAHKRRLGVAVCIVYMTDGADANGNRALGFMPPERLRRTRHGEALRACAELGVAARDVHFLDFPDGALAEHADEAAGAVAALLARVRPREVYVPYRHDGHPDHDATNAIVGTALAQGAPVMVNEYPVWCWNRWPLTARQVGRTRNPLRRLRRRLRALVFLYRSFRFRVRIADVLDTKRAALAAHRSQTTQLVTDARWLRLQEIEGGDWLNCFFQSHELFMRYPSGERRA